VPHTVLTYSLDTTALDGVADGSYGQAVAAALGVEPERMLKTLLAEVDGRLTCAVVPVAGSLDLKALAAALGGKRAVLAEPAVAARSSGYVVGGISPLGQRTPLPTAVDEGAELFDTVVVSAGRRGLSVELAPAHLVRLTGAVVADLSR
jgi:Cys-tRNA(Pro)/Cys-tRNA(Cys) deacylase